MATVGEKKEKMALALKQQKLKDAKAYWSILEMESKYTRDY